MDERLNEIETLYRTRFPPHPPATFIGRGADGMIVGRQAAGQPRL